MLPYLTTAATLQSKAAEVDFITRTQILIARGAISTIFAYLDTQLPLVYAHIIVFLTKAVMYIQVNNGIRQLPACPSRIPPCLLPSFFSPSFLPSCSLALFSVFLLPSTGTKL